MDFSLGLRLGPRNKKATQQEPPTPSGHVPPPTTSPCLSCLPSACAYPCPGCPTPTCSYTACPSYTAPCPSCPSLPGPLCTCSCPSCPPLTCSHTSYSTCFGPPLAYCHPLPCPMYPCPKGQAACPGSHLGCSNSCGCGPGVTRGSTSCCGVCFRGQRTSRGLCLII